MISSDESLADNFDGPVIEPVRYWKPGEPHEPGVRSPARDVAFARPDLDYWATWANRLRDQRRAAALNKLATRPALDPLTDSRVRADIDRRDVQIFEVMDQQFYPDGIKKILNDALERAGMSDAKERAAVMKALHPRRQADLAQDVCSEPRATIQQLRESTRELAIKLGRSPQEVNAWGDDQIIDFARNYTPPPDAAAVTAKQEGEQTGEHPFENPTVPGGDGPGNS